MNRQQVPLVPSPSPHVTSPTPSPRVRERKAAAGTRIHSDYDAWVVALAEAIAAPVATLDRRLAGSTGPQCEFLTPD